MNKKMKIIILIKENFKKFNISIIGFIRSYFNVVIKVF